MEALEVLLILLAVVAAVTLVAERIRMPYPILMVIAGLALTFVPEFPSVELDPDVVLVIFLPPILFAAAYGLSPRELKRNIRPIGLLAIGLVVATTAAVAAVAMAFAPQLGWPMAIALGAIVSPPDAIAATSIARRLDVPRRLVTIFEGESLVNDATALTIYRLAVAAAVTGVAFDTSAVFTGFVVVAVGGALVGLVIGWITSQLLAWLEDPAVEVLITLIAPFAAYLPAEKLHVSGVIATVVAGLIVGYRSPRVMASATRVIGTATWGMVIFVVNGLAFLLIGLQLPTVRQDVTGLPGETLAAMTLAICATVVLLRLAWVFPATYVPRWLSPSLARRDPAPPPAVPLILGWGGMRGAVTLAAALALPLVTRDGDPLPGRSLVVFLAFAVILVTLIGQGLTLPALIRALGVIDDGSLEHEVVHARMIAADAALVRIEQLRAEAAGHLPMLDRMRDQYRDRLEHLDHDEGDTDGADGAAETGESDLLDVDVNEDATPEEIEELEHDAIRRAVISAERLAIVELRDRDEISDAALRVVERDLDLDELRKEA